MNPDPSMHAVSIAASPTDPPANPIAAARGRQILFYAADGLLGGTFTCSRCGASGRQPDVIDHQHDCSYRPSECPP